MVIINPNIRLYLPDVLSCENKEEVLEYLTQISNTIRSAKLFFWYHEPDLTQKQVKEFIEDWESRKHSNFKTIVRPYYFDNQNDFIWYDLISHKMINSLTPRATGIKNEYVRFTWRYGEPNSILKGLKEFKVIYDFVSSEKPTKRQKRNDGEDSNHRVSELHKQTKN